MPGMPGPVADEREGLLAFLAQQRQLLRNASFGLTDEQARATPSASELSVGGLIKHISAMERAWVDTMLQRRGERSTEEAAAAYGDDFQLGPDETLAGTIADNEQAAAETTEALAGFADLGQPVPVPRDAPWFPRDVEAWSGRWVLLHLIEEIARHAGHADIVRESIDGATTYELLAAAEGWPETDWLKPWTPPTTASTAA